MPTPGAPSLLNPPAAVAPQPVVTFDKVTVIAARPRNQWGIYLTNTSKLVVVSDSMVALDYRREWRLSDYPQEKGSFESYNKVAVPFDVRVRMTKGGSDADRRAFLNALEGASASLDLYDVVSPEWYYLKVNIINLDYRREASNGLGLITVEIGLRQVRVTATAAFTATQAPSGADPVNGGTVQAKVPASAQSSAVSAAVASVSAAANPSAASAPITSASSATAAARLPQAVSAAAGAPSN